MGGNKARRSVWALLALVLSVGASVALAEDMVLAESHPPTHPIVQAEEMFKSRLAERSKGEFKVQIKHSGELGNENKAWDKVRAGEIAFTRINLATMVNDVPAIKLLSLPFLFRSRDHMWRVLAGDFGKRVSSEIERSGAILLAYYDSGSRSFYTNKRPIRSRSDFKGLKIRVQPSPVYLDLITELGATPVAMPYDKVADALKTGEIDAAENNLTSYHSADHDKYAKYYSFDEHSSVPEALIMSKKAWNALKPEQQKMVLDTAAESSELMKKLWAESEAQSMAKSKKEGAVFVEKSQIAMAGIESFAVKLYTKYVTDMKDLETVLAIVQSK